jgi:hypothetical protein
MDSSARSQPRTESVPLSVGEAVRAGAQGPRVHDFRQGCNGWGHRLHASTWRALPPRTITTGRLWWRKTAPLPDQVSVMVHCSAWPEVGDRLLMTGESGKDWNLLIAGVEPCWNPRDMFTLTLEDDGSPSPSKVQP